MGAEGRVLAALTWPEVAQRAATTLLAVPLGSTEQHGPHLPLATDTTVAEELARRLAATRPDVLVAPSLPYGASGEHAGFAGTLSLGLEVLEAVVVELVRSADAFAGVVLVSGHGGNAAALVRAVARLEAEGRAALRWSPRLDGDAHAGRTETSLLLGLGDPDVRLEQAAAGDRRPLGELMGELRRGGVASVSANGVLGDPSGVSAEEGEALVQQLAADLAAAGGAAVATTVSEPLPDGFSLALDPGTRRCAGGRVVVGGAPVTVLRLSAGGARLVDRLAAGVPVPALPAAQHLARRLLRTGIACPLPRGGAVVPDDVAVVVPVHGGARDVEELLPSLRAAGAAAVVVVDDGSPDGGAAAAAAAGAEVLRHPRRRGPAAARNTGWRSGCSPVVAFVDVDCRLPDGWLTPLLAHLDDPEVGAVAPRVVGPFPTGGARARDGYEAARGALDRGGRAAEVRPGSTVPFVPSAVLVVRRAALVDVDGFDESLAVGEDVDLVWRLVAAGWAVRYEPAVRVEHRARRSGGAWLRQRYGYGTSAAALAARHGAAVAPVVASPTAMVPWALLVAGRPRLALLAGGALATSAVRRLAGAGVELDVAGRLVARGQVAALAGLVVAGRRTYWPLLALAALASRRARRLAMAVAVVPPLVEWLRHRPPVRLAPWVGLRLADDVAYGSGVWWGCLRARSWQALRPARRAARLAG